MAVAAKAQHEPHACWSFTGDTEPWTNHSEDQGHVTDIHQSQPTLSLQSTDSGRSSSLISVLLGMVKLVLTRARELRRPLA